MFDDPRSGADRRATKQSIAIAEEEEKRWRIGDRRGYGRQNKPWWLMRHYIAVERLHGGQRS